MLSWPLKPKNGILIPSCEGEWELDSIRVRLWFTYWNFEDSRWQTELTNLDSIFGTKSS